MRPARHKRRVVERNPAPMQVAANSKAVMAAIVGAGLGALWPAHGICAEESAPPDHPMMRDRFVLGVGVSRTESSVTASLNGGRLGLGSIIDFEDDLGLSKENVIGVLAFSMRMGERWRLDMEY